MLKLFLAAVVVAVVAADLDAKWSVFKATHNKKYSSQEDPIRKYIWIENKKYIEEHNKLYNQGLSTYYMGESKFTDTSNSEFVARMNGRRVNVTVEPTKSFNQIQNLPATVDWRTKGYVTPVKNQGHCKSDWAFSATGSMEGQHFKSTGKLVNLSVSNLIDCTGVFGNNGCYGGLMDLSFKYVISNNGIDTEDSYPYRPQNHDCHFVASQVGATISSYQDIPAGSESALQKAVAEVGPVSVAIDASHPSFQHYSGGVYSEPKCMSTYLHYAALTVGYGTENSTDYWLVKNSWGTSWGMEGYIKMIRNDNNNCGIASNASYPIV